MTQRLIRERGRHWTRTLVPNQRVYGEFLRRFQGHEYRDWAARRSKLAAYLERGGRAFQLRGTETVLYLGAASGTTVSHLSDLAPEGRIVAVEFSPRPFRDLLELAGSRPNILPVLADAHAPELYEVFLERPADVVVQDIAQPDQAQIFLRNWRHLASPGARGFLAVKARSIDVAAAPERIYEEVRQTLEQGRVPVREVVSLDPFEKDHAMLVVGPAGAHGGAPKPEKRPQAPGRGAR